MGFLVACSVSMTAQKIGLESQIFKVARTRKNRRNSALL